MKDFMDMKSGSFSEALAAFLLMLLICTVFISGGLQLVIFVASFLFWEPPFSIGYGVVRASILVGSVMGLLFASDIYKGKV